VAGAAAAVTVVLVVVVVVLVHVALWSSCYCYCCCHRKHVSLQQTSTDAVHKQAKMATVAKFHVSRIIPLSEKLQSQNPRVSCWFRIESSDISFHDNAKKKFTRRSV